jgi:4-hydroxy-tetrahydrodipicolinate synthase
MRLPAIHGVIPILVTPFDEHGRIDRDSLQSEVDFVIDAGVHAIGIALGSEIDKLSEAERELVTRTVIDRAAGRVPVVVNTGAPANDLAARNSRQAREWGAAAVMATPPGAGFSAEEIVGYYEAIADAAELPVVIQDVNTAPVPAPLIRAIAERVERVRYAKVESSPQPSQILAAARAGGELVAIIGGAAGQFLMEELRRGSIGTMPWPSLPGPFVKVWNAWQAGDPVGARTLFETRVAPLLRVPAFSLGAGHRLHKEVLRRQGVIASAAVRRPSDPLDSITLEELDEACALLGIG